MSSANLLNVNTNAPSISLQYAGGGSGPGGNFVAGNNISITPSVLGNAINVSVTNDLNMGNNDIIAIDNLKLLDNATLADATINFDGTNVNVDKPIKPSTIADSTSSTGTTNQLLASNGAGGLVWVNGGGAGVGVNSVTGGTNISTTGTTTDPIVNLSISSDINMATAGGNYSINNINNAMFRHLPSFNTATISFDATNITTDKPIKPDGICDNNNVTGAAGQVLTSDGAGNIVWAAGGSGSGVTSITAGTGISVTGPTATPTISNIGLLGLTSANAGTNITITGTSTAPIISATGSAAPGLTLVERFDYSTYNIPAPTATGQQLTIYSSIGYVGPQFGVMGNTFPTLPPNVTALIWTCVENDGNAQTFWYGGYYIDNTSKEWGIIAKYDTNANTWNTPYIFTKQTGSPNMNARVNCLKIDSDKTFLYVGGDFNDSPGLSPLPGIPNFFGCAFFDTTAPNLYVDMGPILSFSHPPSAIAAFKSQNFYDTAVIYAIEEFSIGPTVADHFTLVGGEFSWISVNNGGGPTPWSPANNIICVKNNPSTPGTPLETMFVPTYLAAIIANASFINPTNAGFNGIVYSIYKDPGSSNVLIGGAFTQQNGGSGSGGTDYAYLAYYDYTTDAYVSTTLAPLTTTGANSKVTMVQGANNLIWVGLYDLNIDLTATGGSATNTYLITLTSPTPTAIGYGTSVFGTIAASPGQLVTAISYNPSNGRYIIIGTNLLSNPAPLIGEIYEFITGVTPSLTALTTGLNPNIIPCALKMINNATNNLLYIPSGADIIGVPPPQSATITYEYDITSGPNVYPAGILFGDGTTQTSVSLGLNQAINLVGIAPGGKYLLASKNF